MGDSTMADSTIPVPGVLSLPEIEREITFEEKKSFELLTSRIENNKDNLVDFKELDIGTFPKDLKLTLEPNPPPNGYDPYPNNPIAMIVGGLKKSVHAWRKR
jgi:hypothetical protein